MNNMSSTKSEDADSDTGKINCFESGALVVDNSKKPYYISQPDATEDGALITIELNEYLVVYSIKDLLLIHNGEVEPNIYSRMACDKCGRTPTQYQSAHKIAKFDGYPEKPLFEITKEKVPEQEEVNICESCIKDIAEFVSKWAKDHQSIVFASYI